MLVRFVYEKDTKNKVRFTEESEDETVVIGKLYLDKGVYENFGSPERIAVTIEKIAGEKKK